MSSSNNVVDSIREGGLDAILSVRESLGAAMAQVSIVTRTWTGLEVGDGDQVETLTAITPTPGIRTFAHDTRVKEGGAIQQGDILIKQISQNQFPLETDIDCSSTSKLIEKFYRVGEKDYTVVNVRRRQVTWNVLLRRKSDQTRFR